MLRRPNIPALTTLRFFAALLVVIFHYNLTAPIFPFALAHFGYQAVTFFFILSGFILTYTHGTSVGLNVSLREFFAARIAQISPAYYLALILALPFFVRSGQLSSAPFVLSMTSSLDRGVRVSMERPCLVTFQRDVLLYLLPGDLLDCGALKRYALPCDGRRFSLSHCIRSRDHIYRLARSRHLFPFAKSSTVCFRRCARKSLHQGNEDTLVRAASGNRGISCAHAVNSIVPLAFEYGIPERSVFGDHPRSVPDRPALEQQVDVHAWRRKFRHLHFSFPHMALVEPSNEGDLEDRNTARTGLFDLSLACPRRVIGGTVSRGEAWSQIDPAIHGQRFPRHSYARDLVINRMTPFCGELAIDDWARENPGHRNNAGNSAANALTIDKSPKQNNGNWS